MEGRPFEILKRRVEDRAEGWSFRRKPESLVAERFRQGPSQSRDPRRTETLLGRHDYGTRVTKKTGNLKAVMKVMSHRDVKTAMNYRHPEVNIVPALGEREVVHSLNKSPWHPKSVRYDQHGAGS